MKSTAEPCFICGGSLAAAHKGAYLRCSVCGHETAGLVAEDVFMVNDILSVEMVRKYDMLERSRTNVLRRCMRDNALLLDIGSGSGKFLYHHRAMFTGHLGIEITAECADFAEHRLGLRIARDISALDAQVSVCTFWHSLEHIPAGEIDRIMNTVMGRSTDNTSVIVSVPNRDSMQYRIFGNRFAYYDYPAHIHQFSRDSLDRLMEKYGLVCSGLFPTLPYAVFGYLQGLLNLCNTIHNYFYFRRKRGRHVTGSALLRTLLDVYNYALFCVFLLPSVAFSIYDLLLPAKGGVVTACYRRKKP